MAWNVKTVSQRQIGERLAALRKRAGFTQAEAAERLDISDETLSRIERGTQWTDFSTLSAMADIYQVEWADLMAVFPPGTGAARRKAVQEVVDLLRPRTLRDVKLAHRLLTTLFSEISSTSDQNQ